jgi:hypothetical protein
LNFSTDSRQLARNEQETDVRKGRTSRHSDLSNLEQGAVNHAFAISALKPLGLSLGSAVREFVAARKIVGDFPLLRALKFWQRHHAPFASEPFQD